MSNDTVESWIDNYYSMVFPDSFLERRTVRKQLKLSGRNLRDSRYEHSSIVISEKSGYIDCLLQMNRFMNSFLSNRSKKQVNQHQKDKENK